MKWILGVIGVLLAIALVFVFFILPPRLDGQMNVVLEHAPFEISDKSRALHETLRVADLHADTLLWARDPARRQTRGQTDLVRLSEGGVRLQVFSAVTKTPKNMNYDQNSAEGDNITLAAIIQRWPRRTWGSLAERALYQADRLHRLEAAKPDAFAVVTNQLELQAALAAGQLAGVLATEGAHPFEGDLANFDRLYAAGYRVIGLQHFFDNELGGSLHGMSGEGLTDFGREAVAAIVAKGAIIDLAHSSEAVVRDVLALSNKPLIVSHTGIKGHCDSPRNISDELMIEIAGRGGLIGIGFWDGAVCDSSPEGVAAAILYGVNLLGAEHIALGSDFDGAVTTKFDASELAALTDALFAAGADDETIRAVMGENMIRFFEVNLPD